MPNDCSGLVSMALYEYAPLDSSRDEIRIVRFSKPSTSGETILQCTLQHVAWRYRAEYQRPPKDLINGHVTIPSRFDWGDFEAISYCWDSNIRDRDFLIDGKVIRVTSNLEALLQELQKLPEALSGMGFWVHGLCINQEDMMEKNSRVRLMSCIYSQAMSTVVWLGLPTLNSNTAIDKILEFFGDHFINYPSKYGHENHRTFPTGKFETFPVSYWSSIMDHSRAGSE
jgi:hypothetical protein